MTTQYKLLKFGNVVRLSDNVCIPPDPNNSDYAKYLRWVELGGVPIPADPIPTPPNPRISQLPVVDPNEVAVAAAKSYLISTDYMMTADYDKDTDAVKILRSQARATIRSFINTNH